MTSIIMNGPLNLLTAVLEVIILFAVIYFTSEVMDRVKAKRLKTKPIIDIKDYTEELVEENYELLHNYR